MKYLFLIIGLFFSSNLLWAECKLDVAISAGKYLDALEKAKLSRYQNNSVCEVLARELNNCTREQLLKISRIYNYKEVRGNYCQPHLPPYPSTDKSHFLKGAELYSWKEYYGYYWYALVPGTNRQKTTKEIRKQKLSLDYLKAKLKQLPPNTEISWNNLISISDKQNLNFKLPSTRMVNRIKSEIAKSNHQLEKLSQ